MYARASIVLLVIACALADISPALSKHVFTHADWPPSYASSAAVNTTASLMWRTVLNDTTSQSIGARCLDGSPSGYFFRPSPTNSTRWIIFLQGGGLCVTPKDCDDRTKDMYGSSTFWPTNVTGIGILSGDATMNPDFYQDNMVWVPYCTGDLYSGQRNESNVIGYPHLYFAGHLTLQAILTQLQADRGLRTATQVILSGDSAGGIGTFINADYVTQTLSWADVKAMPIAGWFISIHTWSGLPPIGDTFELPYVVYNAYIDPDCKKVHPTNPWVCFLAYYTQEYTSTPLFVGEAQFDEQQMYTEDGLKKGLNSTKARTYCKYFGQQMRAQLAPLLDSNNTLGLFSPSCLVHVVDWNTVRLSNITFQQAFGNWYFNRPGPTKLLDNCGDLPCTADCQHFPLPETMLTDRVSVRAVKPGTRKTLSQRSRSTIIDTGNTRWKGRKGLLRPK